MGFKKSILSDIVRTATDLEDMISLNPKNIYFFTPTQKIKELENLYDEKNGKAILTNENDQELETLINFDRIPLEEKEFLLKYTFQIKSLHGDQYLVDLNFENFYVPSNE